MVVSSPTTVLAVLGTERSSHQRLSDSVSALEPAAPAGELCRGDTRDSSYGDTHNDVDLYLKLRGRKRKWELY